VGKLEIVQILHQILHKPSKTDYKQRRLILTDTINVELANAREIRDSINTALQNRLNTVKPIVAGISKSQYNRNIILTTTEEFNAA
jgi:ubiquinone biosynthesis protein COQ9